MSDITNEMKAKCMGEFSFPIPDACPIVVPWHTCKEIYKAMLSCSPAAAQLAALKEENERLLRELSDAGSRIVDLEAGEEILNARVAELEKGSISKSLIISRIQKLPDEYRMNWHYAEIICGIIDSINDGDFDNKEPANEG